MISGHAVTHNVRQQLEKGEDQRQDQERRHDHCQVKRKVAQNHVIEDEREARAEPSAVRSRCRLEAASGAAPARANRLQLLQQQLPSGSQIADLDGHAVYAPQQEQAADKEEDVAHPRAKPRGHPSLASHLHSQQREEVVDHHQQNRQHEARAFAAFTRG